MARIGINTGSAANDNTGSTLRAAGGIINDNFLEIYTRFGDGTNLTSIGGTWTSTSVGIHTLKNVGIGTTNPTSALTVGAVGSATTNLVVNGFAKIDQIVIKNNSNSYQDNIIMTQHPAGTFTGGRNVAIGDYSFTTPGAAGENVAIGYYALNVLGNNDIYSTWDGNTALGCFSGQSSTYTLRNTLIGYNSGKFITNCSNNTLLGSYDGNQNGLDIRTSDGNVVLSDGDGNIRFYANSSGNVGLGTTNPTSKLTVSGDVLVSNKIVAGLTSSIIPFYWENFSDLPSFSTYHGAFAHVHQTGKAYYAHTRWVELVHTEASGVVGTGTEIYNVGIVTASTLNVGTGGTVITTTTAGLVGIGTTTPTEKLTVVGVTSSTSFYGDVSYTASGRWTLGANGFDDYTFTGIGFTQTTNDPVLYLARGRVYEFVNNSGGSHPFQIRVSDGGAAYSDGVTNNSAASGVIRFEVPFNAPNTLYYQCTSHSGMGNTISVYPNTI